MCDKNTAHTPVEPGLNMIRQREDSTTIKAREIYDKATPPLILLSALGLILFSTILPHQGEEGLGRFSSPVIQTAFTVLMAIRTVYVIDFIIFLFAIRGQKTFWKRTGRALGVVLFPIFRISMSTFSKPRKIWIPFLGWRNKNRTLERKLAAAFSLPMILIVLLILPILCIEYFKREWLEYAWVKGTLSVGSQIIWLAFTIEFVLMISVTRKKLAYCTKRWIDIAIICLPLILFMIPLLSFLPIARLARVSRLIRSTQLFRMKGAGLKAFQAMVLFSGTRRFGKRAHEKKLLRLKKLLREKEEELEELKLDITHLEDKLKEQDP